MEKSTDFDLLGLGSFDLSTSSSSNRSTSGSDTHSSSSKLLILRIRLLRIPIDFSFRLFQTSIPTKIKFDIERVCWLCNKFSLESVTWIISTNHRISLLLLSAIVSKPVSSQTGLMDQKSQSHTGIGSNCKGNFEHAIWFESDWRIVGDRISVHGFLVLIFSNNPLKPNPR